MNIHDMEGQIVELLKLPKFCTKVEVKLTLEVGHVPLAEVTYYPNPNSGVETRTATFECYGTHSREIK